ncbi:SPX domain-containing protein [Halteromyces radiatus]|uniref:SPX domain-containing protein n=1 Tax=Halteromyces radiatus TaxID=101107 RepID=UPI00221E9466|nr:SPX domain-containing protein [Halteromyces radiatus]KAI8096293.1 SPX domain-containing protein [Halteromyces radiatus]
MKFAKHLESESIPEWRKAYINYKGLKKRLKFVDKFRKSNEHKAALELAKMFHDSDGHDTSHINHMYQNNTNDIDSNQDDDDDDDHSWYQRTTWNMYRPSSLPLLQQWTNTRKQLTQDRPGSFQSTATLSVWDEVLLHANESERVFFNMLNQELDKVSLFFNDKENESRAKFESVKMQIKLIADYGRYLLEIGVKCISILSYWVFIFFFPTIYLVYHDTVYIAISIASLSIIQCTIFCWSCNRSSY